MDIKWVDECYYECEECKKPTYGYHSVKSLTNNKEKKYLCYECRDKLFKNIYFQDPENTFYTRTYVPDICDEMESEMVIYNNKDDIINYYKNYEIADYIKCYGYAQEYGEDEYVLMVVGNKEHDFWVREFTNLDLSKYFPYYRDLIKKLEKG